MSILIALSGTRGEAQHADQPEAEVPVETPNTVFPHSDTARFLISGQTNVIFQAHPGFHSPYEGDNSLLARGEYKVSIIGTLFTGFQLVRNPRYATDALFDLESAGGRGISEALGLAGFTNLDVVRNPSLGSVPYVARVQLHQILGLTSKLGDASRTPNALSTKVPLRRIDLRVGRLGLPDVFDLNGPGSDSHLQFMNWTVDNNGAYDYAADTRGYTYAAIAEYDDRLWSMRYAVALMPTVANGIDLDWNLRRARGENYEFELRNSPLQRLLAHLGQKDRLGAIRLLAYENHGDMGLYRNANKAALAARAAGEISAAPVIADHPQATTVKYGFGINTDQQITSTIRAFSRFGWNEGQHESFCYTEVDQTFQAGADIAGPRWGRPNDRFGVVGVTNAIKRDHQQYLALGGKGFLLGDGRLNYAREDILESYYNAHNWRGLFTAFDVQLVAHPGYNQDRGPVAVFSVRTHVDF
ncbi:MAG: carbohydrate porin [Janthinobacterium lividum]